MNLTEEKKTPLRQKTVKEKRDMLQMQFKGTIRVGLANPIHSKLRLI